MSLQSCMLWKASLAGEAHTHSIMHTPVLWHIGVHVTNEMLGDAKLLLMKLHRRYTELPSQMLRTEPLTHSVFGTSSLLRNCDAKDLKYRDSVSNV